MIFHYVAIDAVGKRTDGDVDFTDLTGVLQFLSAQGLKPISIKPVSGMAGGIHRFFGGISLKDKIFLTRYLSLMLKVGTDLVSAVNILIADYDKPAMKQFLAEVRASLAKGQPFFQAFARYPKVFSPVFINLVRAAETSGHLQETFSELSVSLQKESELRGKVQGALIYPLVLLFVATVVFSFLSLFALPKIANVFLDSGIKPPFFSQIVFTVGLFFGNHIVFFLVGGIALVSFLIYFFGFNLAGRRIFDRILSNTPLVSAVYYDLAVQRFAATFSSLMRAGVPIIQSVHITADVVGPDEFRRGLLRVADEGLAKGLSIGESFRREKVFPTVITNLMAIAEKAGHLDEVLSTVADFYATNVDASLRALVSILEPVLLIGMGVIAGTIALSIILPIYQLTSSF